jgi:hypothetical protein
MVTMGRRREKFSDELAPGKTSDGPRGAGFDDNGEVALFFERPIGQHLVFAVCRRAEQPASLLRFFDCDWRLVVEKLVKAA